MAYIGRGTDNISNVEVLDNITFNGNSSYTLQKGGANFVPVSANNILVSIDGVVQANNFSVSGSTIDFGTAVTGTCNFVLHFGTGLITTVQDGAVTTAKIGDDAVTYAKLQNLATANRVLGSTSTGLIGETQIATAMVSDDAITYAKMQDTSAANRVLGAASAGTVGEVQVATDMIADAQVDESKLKISNTPTNGYFLSAQSGNTGGLTWAEAGGGAFTLLSTTNVSSAVAQVDITSNIDSTYKKYHVSIINLHPSTDADLNLRVFKTADGGSVYSGSGYRSSSLAYRSDDSSMNDGMSTTYYPISLVNVGGASDENISAEIELYNPSETVFSKLAQSRATVADNSSKNVVIANSCIFQFTGAYNGFRLYMSSGTIDSAIIKLYGVS